MAAFEPALIHFRAAAHDPLSPARLDQLARDSGLAFRNTTLHPGGTNATNAALNKPRARFPNIEIPR